MNEDRCFVTRCYAITASLDALSAVERVLKRIETAGERGSLELAMVMADGRGGELIAVGIVAEWVGDADEGRVGTRLPEEEAITGVLVVEIAG